VTSNGLTLALWALNLDQGLDRPEDWLDQLERRLAEAAAGGAELLALPEYASAVWLNWAPAGTTADREVAWMAGQAERQILPALPGLVRRHGIALLAGSMPADMAGTHRNRGHLFLPDGRHETQDKLCLTPVEREPRSWFLSPGDVLRIVEWRGWRIAVLICLDVELPALAARLASERIDLILVPSQTARRSGLARVTACARARAIELMCATAIAGCIGPAGVERFSNVGGTAAFIPCETSLGSTAILLEDCPYDTVDGPGPLTFARLPLGEIRRLRTDGAEVWPGPWRAEHVRIERA
jgi:predicted amidohydrolase